MSASQGRLVGQRYFIDSTAVEAFVSGRARVIPLTAAVLSCRLCCTCLMRHTACVDRFPELDISPSKKIIGPATVGSTEATRTISLELCMSIFVFPVTYRLIYRQCFVRCGENYYTCVCACSPAFLGNGPGSVEYPPSYVHTFGGIQGSLLNFEDSDGPVVLGRRKDNTTRPFMTQVCAT